MFAVGIAVWTLSEYWLHRLLFHWQPKIPGGDRIHFIMHGVHHDHPNDPMRLVMPPAVSIPMSAVFAGAFYLIFGDPLETSTMTTHVFVGGEAAPTVTRQTLLRDRYRNPGGELPPAYVHPNPASPR